MNADTIAVIAGAILSLLFSYVPGLNTKFAELVTETKQLIMAGLMLLVAGAAYGLACAGVGDDFGIVVSCDVAGIIALVKAFFLAIAANQGIFKLSPTTKSVMRAKTMAKSISG